MRRGVRRRFGRGQQAVGSRQWAVGSREDTGVFSRG